MTSALLAPVRHPSAEPVPLKLLPDGCSPHVAEDKGWEVPTTEGRKVRVRVCPHGEAVQLAIVSTRGNIIEAVTLDSGQLNALIGALSKAGTKADRDLMAALKDAEAEAGERYRQALARNPWMKPGREKRGLA